jgi:hypothetical protein
MWSPQDAYQFLASARRRDANAESRTPIVVARIAEARRTLFCNPPSE